MPNAPTTLKYFLTYHPDWCEPGQHITKYVKIAHDESVYGYFGVMAVFINDTTGDAYRVQLNGHVLHHEFIKLEMDGSKKRHININASKKAIKASKLIRESGDLKQQEIDIHVKKENVEAFLEALTTRIATSHIIGEITTQWIPSANFHCRFVYKGSV
jgi:hypothetical protein